MKFRYYKFGRVLDVYVGEWAIRFTFCRVGRFSNGSRWHSGWYRWRDQPDY